MKEKTSTLSLTALAAGMMSIITIFGGYTVFLGVLFAFAGILTGIRGRRISDTAAATWAVRLSVFGLILCTVVSFLFVILYLTSMVDLNFDFGLHSLYDKGKELMIRIIEKF